MFCAECGNEIGGSAKFCPNCGAKASAMAGVVASVASAPEPVRSDGSAKIFFEGSGVLVSEAMFRTSTGASYPIRNITSVAVGKQTAGVLSWVGQIEFFALLTMKKGEVSMRNLFALILIQVFAMAASAAPVSGAGGSPRLTPNEDYAESAPLESIDRISAKSLSDGLVITGQFTYLFYNGNASLTLDRIENNSSTRTTGTLRLSMWATTYQPVRGASITGYRLVDFATFTPLAPRTYWYDIVRGAPHSQPPSGAYWIVLVLSEYNPTACPGNSDGYCLTDSVVSYTQSSFGTAAPTYTYTDIWYNPNESGWGLSVTHHSNNISFIAWYTYDESGRPKWYVVSNCPMVGNSCSGAVYEATGPSFSQPWNSSQVALRPVGTMTLTFSSSGNGNMTYFVNGVFGSKFITRFLF